MPVTVYVPTSVLGLTYIARTHLHSPRRPRCFFGLVILILSRFSLLVE